MGWRDPSQPILVVPLPVFVVRFHCQCYQPYQPFADDEDSATASRPKSLCQCATMSNPLLAGASAGGGGVDGPKLRRFG